MVKCDVQIEQFQVCMCINALIVGLVSFFFFWFIVTYFTEITLSCRPIKVTTSADVYVFPDM